MSGNDVLKYSVENRVALITIDRPPHNILPLAYYRELCKTAINLVKKKEARAIVITGSNKVFISGLDVNDINALKTAQDNNRMTLEIKALFRQVEKLPRPVIAAIDGNCFGGGLELALSCHMRLASPEARLGLLEINLGTMPSLGGTQRLPRLVGRAKGLELMLTGRQVSGEEALGIGLVNAVYPSSDLVEQAKTLAYQIAEKNCQAVEAVMRATTEGLEMGFDQGCVFESTCSSELTGTHNMKEGMAAFFERRKPVYRDE
ncbi:MAG: putative enoyl-CoA hydratase [Syntrophorhabdus sp. PtaU1.Bin050]|nr:MAG: putative enoyl-CoA hydratase [Syntrophorhabdus sp. PtaU1.Bin050]